MLIEKLEDGVYKVLLAFEYQKLNTGALIDIRALTNAEKNIGSMSIEYGHPEHNMFSVPYEKWQYMSETERRDRFLRIDQSRVCGVFSDLAVETLESTRRILTAKLVATGEFAGQLIASVERTDKIKLGVRAFYGRDFVTELVAWDLIDNDQDEVLTWPQLQADPNLTIQSYWTYRISNKIVLDSIEADKSGHKEDIQG